MSKQKCMILEQIQIPMNEAGIRCFEVFVQVALRQLHSAREATASFISSETSRAKIVDEHAMFHGKYSIVLDLPDSKRKIVTYDYRTKAIEII